MRRRSQPPSGYGPRFLHSTGQLHKGGPDSGVFIQITAGDINDIDIPGEKFTFGVLKQAQALGDFESLVSRHRRAIRVDLGARRRKGAATFACAGQGGGCTGSGHGSRWQAVRMGDLRSMKNVELRSCGALVTMSTLVQPAPVKLAKPTLPKGDSCLLVIFGATGDLTRRKLIPALYDLACVGCTNRNFDVLGIGRTKLTDDDFRARIARRRRQTRKTRATSATRAGTTLPSACIT